MVRAVTFETDGPTFSISIRDTKFGSRGEPRPTQPTRSNSIDSSAFHPRARKRRARFVKRNEKERTVEKKREHRTCEARLTESRTSRVRPYKILGVVACSIVTSRSNFRKIATTRYDARRNDFAYNVFYFSTRSSGDFKSRRALGGRSESSTKFVPSRTANASLEHDRSWAVRVFHIDDLALLSLRIQLRSRRTIIVPPVLSGLNSRSRSRVTTIELDRP